MDDFSGSYGGEEPEQTSNGAGPGCRLGAAFAGGVADGTDPLPPRFYRFDAAEVELPGAADELWPLDSLLLNRSKATAD